MDYLDELSVTLKGKVKQQHYTDANIGISTRRLLIKNYRKFHVEINEFVNRYSIDLKVNSVLHFSVNKSDFVFGNSQPNKLKNFPCIVYTGRHSHISSENMGLEKFWNLFSVLLNGFQLTASECVFFYSNKVTFVLDAARDVRSALDKIIDFVTENNTIFKRKVAPPKINADKIPDNIKAVILFLKKYSISDDSERDELVEQMSDDEKTNLKETIFSNNV